MYLTSVFVIFLILFFVECLAPKSSKIELNEDYYTTSDYINKINELKHQADVLAIVILNKELPQEDLKIRPQSEIIGDDLTSDESDESLEEEDDDKFDVNVPKELSNAVGKNVLRFKWKGCTKKVRKVCCKACVSAYKNVCTSYKCSRRMKKAFKKECKNSCKDQFDFS